MSETLYNDKDLNSFSVDEQIDKVEESEIPIHFDDEPLHKDKKLRLLSLFSGCGGMDLGFEGNFIANKKSFAEDSSYIDHQQKNNNWDGFIVTNPNCSTIALTLTLKPIYDNFNINRIYVSTMQAVSGAGYNGVPSMAIVDNLVPYIGGEEEKMESETLHLLGSLDGDEVVPANFSLSASCHRVPVIDGHTEAVFVELDDEADIDKIKKTMADFRGLPQELGLHSAPDQPVIVKEEDDRPQPRMDRMAYGGMAATVGRVRKDQAFDNSFKYVLVGHNTIRGAAGASILNAELINKQIL